MKCIRMLTFLPLEQIDEMDKWEGSELNHAKEILAYELTKLVHGEEEAEKAQAGAKALFGQGGANTENMPTTTLTDVDFTDGKITVIDMLLKSGLCPSKSEARRLIQQGGVFVNDEKVAAFDAAVDAGAFGADGVIVKKGKKTYHKFVK